MISPIAGSMGEASFLRHQRLERAARQFEGMLMQELLKPLRETQDEEQGHGDTMKSYGTEVLATAMASRGGLGFGARMMHSVEQREKNLIQASSSGTPRR